MARRKAGKEHIRKIQYTSGSYSVRMPIRIMRELKWRERQKVNVKKFGRNKIIISDWKK